MRHLLKRCLRDSTCRFRNRFCISTDKGSSGASLGSAAFFAAAFFPFFFGGIGGTLRHALGALERPLRKYAHVKPYPDHTVHQHDLSSANAGLRSSGVPST